MSAIKLNACPCCGFDHPKLTDTSTHSLLEVSVAIFSLVLCSAQEGGCGLQSGWYETDKEAAQAWNKRHVNLHLEARASLIEGLASAATLIRATHAEAAPRDLANIIDKARVLVSRIPMDRISVDEAQLNALLQAVQADLQATKPTGEATLALVRFINGYGAKQRTEGYAKKVSNAECGALAMLAIETERANTAEARVTELEQLLARPTDLEKLRSLVRAYGNTPLLGPGRTSTDIMLDIEAMVAPAREEN